MMIRVKNFLPFSIEFKCRVNLLIPVCAKTVANVRAFMASTTVTEAIHLNPAGLSGWESSEALFSYTDYIAGMKLSYFSTGYYMCNLG